MRRMIAPLALMVALSLGAPACADDPTAPDPGASPVAEPPRADPPGEPLIEDGVHFGFVRTVADPGATESSVTFDVAELFVGEAATVAAIEDGEPSDGEELLDDHYIRNPERDFAVLPLTEDVVILAIDQEDCCDPVEIDLATFASAFLEEREDQTLVGPEAPYQVTVRDGHVERIEEVDLP